MRLRPLLVLFALVFGITGGTSWAEKVLCIHPGQPVSYAHVEKADLSDLTFGELHINLSPEWVTSPGDKTAEKFALNPSKITEEPSGGPYTRGGLLSYKGGDPSFRLKNSPNLASIRSVRLLI